MAKYQHKRGQIQDNAVKALLNDPLFKQRIEKNHKGKGSYKRRDKHANKSSWESSDKHTMSIFITALSFGR